MSDERANRARVKTLKTLAKKKSNKLCFNCQRAGPQNNVVLDFATFVCMSCAGLHRSFNHKVKSINMARFSDADVEKFNEGGNRRAAKEWLYLFDPKDYSINKDSTDNVRAFMTKVYTDKQWHKSKATSADKREKKKKKKEKSKRSKSSAAELDPPKKAPVEEPAAKKTIPEEDSDDNSSGDKTPTKEEEKAEPPKEVDLLANFGDIDFQAASPVPPANDNPFGNDDNANGAATEEKDDKNSFDVDFADFGGTETTSAAASAPAPSQPSGDDGFGFGSFDAFGDDSGANNNASASTDNNTVTLLGDTPDSPSSDQSKNALEDVVKVLTVLRKKLSVSDEKFDALLQKARVRIYPQAAATNSAPATATPQNNDPLGGLNDAFSAVSFPQPEETQQPPANDPFAAVGPPGGPTGATNGALWDAPQETAEEDTGANPFGDVPADEYDQSAYTSGYDTSYPATPYGQPSPYGGFAQPQQGYPPQAAYGGYPQDPNQFGGYPPQGVAYGYDMNQQFDPSGQPQQQQQQQVSPQGQAAASPTDAAAAAPQSDPVDDMFAFANPLA